MPQLSDTPLSNWIQARFAGGVDFVSDAPEALAESIERAMRRRPLEHAGPEFGWFLLPDHDLSVAYLRCAANGGTPYVHAVTWRGAPHHPSAESVERLFATRYGRPPGPRAQALVRRLASARLAEAMGPLAELFLAAEALQTLEPAKQPAKRAPEPVPSPAPVPIRLVPWIVTAAAVGVAGFALGRTPPGPLMPVDAAPPDFEERLARLEAELQPGDSPLQAQLERERLRHAEALAAKQLEIDALTERLAALAPPGEAPVAIAQVEPGPSAETEGTRKPAADRAAGGPAEAAASAETWVLVPPQNAAVPAGDSAVAAVTADVLWVREGPGTKHRKLARLESGDEVELAGAAEGEWTRIAAPAQGWVASRFITARE